MRQRDLGLNVGVSNERIRDFTVVFVCPQIIVSYPPTKQLTSEEQDLVWKFRYYLTTQEKVCVRACMSSMIVLQSDFQLHIKQFI